MTGEVDLRCKDPHVVDCFICFMYHGCFSFPKEKISHVGFLAAMFAIADEYEVPTLRDYSLWLFTTTLNNGEFNMGELLCIVPAICELLLPERNMLREPLVQQISKDFPNAFVLNSDSEAMQLARARTTSKEALYACPEFAADYRLASSQSTYNIFQANGWNDTIHETAKCKRCNNVRGGHSDKIFEPDVHCYSCRCTIADEDWNSFFKNTRKAMGLDTLDDDKLPEYEDWEEYIRLRDEEYDKATLPDDELPLFDSWRDYLPVVQPAGFETIESENIPRQVCTRGRFIIPSHGSRGSSASNGSSTSSGSRGGRGGRGSSRGPRTHPGHGRGPGPRGGSRSACTDRCCRKKASSDQGKTNWLLEWLDEPAQRELPLVDGKIPFYYSEFHNFIRSKYAYDADDDN